MKKILFALFAFASVVLFASDSKQEIAKKLYGSIRIVDGIADYDVRIVDGIADLDVRITTFASSPGEWRIVDGIADYDVRIVDGIADLDVRILNPDAWPKSQPE